MTSLKKAIHRVTNHQYPLGRGNAQVNLIVTLGPGDIITLREKRRHLDTGISLPLDKLYIRGIRELAMHAGLIKHREKRAKKYLAK